MSQETMDKKLGPEKGKHWRDSGKIKDRPDPFTGSKEEKFKE